MVKDMTKGEPGKVLLGFTLPMLGSVVFQQLYNIVDSVVAGKCIGPNALAAVGSSYPITMIFVAIALGCNVGCSVLISQLFGAKKLEDMKTALYTSLLAALVLSIILTAIGFFGCGEMLRLLQTPKNIFVDSALYLKIYTAGLVFVFLYNICNGIFTALGDSTTPFLFLVISSLANIVLDLVFVICFHMGVSGVAWATFIAQGVAAIAAFIVLLKRIKMIPTEKYQLFSLKMLQKIAWLSIPSILQQSFVSVGNLFIQSMVNSYGSVVIAGYSGAIKLNTFAITSFGTLATSLSNFTAQNIGAGKTERV
ncbi:MAG: MATE family efflux transporter, partial [Lachnospiraceae bacterium]